VVCTQLVIRHPADVAVSLSHSAWRWQPATPTPPPNQKRARPTPEAAGPCAAVDLLAMPGVEDLDLPLPHHLELARAADLF
jgi:hypothetical protein